MVILGFLPYTWQVEKVTSVTQGPYKMNMVLDMTERTSQISSLYPLSLFYVIQFCLFSGFRVMMTRKTTPLVPNKMNMV